MKKPKIKFDKNILKKFFNVVYWILIIIIVSIAGFSAFSVFGLPNQLKLYVVQSGSMHPAIKIGSVVFDKPEKDYKIGDVITYRVNAAADVKNPKLTITHRILSTEIKNNVVFYTTKGDANDTQDMNAVSKDLVLGKVAFTIPYLGFPVGFAKTQNGFILLIVIPATIIVYSELLNIKEETKRLLKERAKRKLNPIEKAEVAVGEEEIVVEKGFKKFLRKFRKNNA